MKFTRKIVFGAGVLGLWLVVPDVRGETKLTRLASFDGGNGSEPWGGVVQGPDGNFYGTCSFGGAYNSGTVFRMSPTGTVTRLYSFRYNSDGAVPQAGLTLGTNGYFYGTTRDAPPYRGTIFRITTNGVLNTLVRFRGPNGGEPWNGALIQGSDGNFYGTTATGGITNYGFPGEGTAFKVTANGGLTTLHFFDYPTGDIPYSGLVEGVDGAFYGTTSGGGRLGGGTVFKLTPDGVHTELVSFHYQGTNGLSPFGGLLQGEDGNFYGTTTQGGESYGNRGSVNWEGFGTIFRMTPNGVLTTLFSFNGTNGSYPHASLMKGNDGCMYGTTTSGGTYTNQLFPPPEDHGYAGYGTVFRITTNGEFTSVVSFAGTDGASPLGSLTLGKDGNFYGTTVRGGVRDLGTAFRLHINSPPTITCPASVTVECGGPVQMSARVNDPDGDALTVVWELNGEPFQTNALPSGNPPTEAEVSLLADFPLGTNVVAVSVTDSEAKTASCSTEVVIVDTTPPAIICASNKAVECGAAWDFDEPTATDSCAGTNLTLSAVITVTNAGCGGTFAAIRTWQAVDSATNTAMCSETVRVVDTTPPEIVCPVPITVEFQDQNGAVVSYAVSASDMCSPVSVAVAPPSGSLFSIGVTTVQATAMDTCTNTASCSFTVTVLGPLGVKSNVLAELVALRALANLEQPFAQKLDDALLHLQNSLDPAYWIDQTHLQPKGGNMALNEEKLAVNKLREIMDSKDCPVDRAILQGFIHRIVKSDRLLAIISIQEAAIAGLNAKKIAQDLDQVAKGDEEAAAGRYANSIEHYRNAWRSALQLRLRLSLASDGSISLKFVGNLHKTFLVEGSSNLLDWTPLGTCSPDAEGDVEFKDTGAAARPSKFYRVVEQ